MSWDKWDQEHRGNSSARVVHPNLHPNHLSQSGAPHSILAIRPLSESERSPTVEAQRLKKEHAKVQKALSDGRIVVRAHQHTGGVGKDIVKTFHSEPAYRDWVEKSRGSFHIKSVHRPSKS